MKYRLVLVLLLVLALGVLGTGQALAVSATADAHAHSRIGGAQEQQVTVHAYQWDLLSATADAQANVAGVHAHGHGYAHVDWFHIGKGNYTHVVYSGGYTPKHGWATASSSTGGFIIDGPEGQEVQICARLVRTGAPLEEEMTPDVHPEMGTFPDHGMYADSFFDIYTEVSVGLSLGGGGGGGMITMMSADLHLGGPGTTAPGLSGHLTGYGETNGFGLLNPYSYSNGGEPRNAVSITSDFVSAPLTVPVGQRLDSFFDIFTEVSQPPDTTSTAIRGAGALFMVQLELVDQSGAFTIHPLLPTAKLVYDPATGQLAMDTQGMALNGFIIHSPRGDFTGGALLPPGFLFNDNTETMIASQFGATLTGTHDFGNAAVKKGNLWNAAEGRWDLDNWEYTYTVDGQTGVCGGDIGVVARLPGDVDLDGDCDAWDIQHILSMNSYNNGAGWCWGDGDFNGDGLVNWQDIQMILDHGQYGEGLGPALLALVPEPATLGLLALGGLALLRRRRN
jgi:hypothetical protein